MRDDQSAQPAGASVQRSPYEAESRLIGSFSSGGHRPSSRQASSSSTIPEEMPTFGARPPPKNLPDHKLNPYRFARDQQLAMQAGEPYTHPTFGFLAPWGCSTQVDAYRGLHASTPTSFSGKARVNDTAASSLGATRPMTPATIARLTSAQKMTAAAGARPATAASSERRALNDSAKQQASGVGPRASPSAYCARPSTAPGWGSAGAARRAARASWSSSQQDWPSGTCKLIESGAKNWPSTTLLRPPHTAHAAQIAARQYPHYHGTPEERRRRPAPPVPVAETEARTSIQGAHDRGHKATKSVGMLDIS
jgi:hypothetical protein